MWTSNNISKLNLCQIVYVWLVTSIRVYLVINIDCFMHENAPYNTQSVGRLASIYVPGSVYITLSHIDFDYLAFVL